MDIILLQLADSALANGLALAHNGRQQMSVERHGVGGGQTRLWSLLSGRGGDKHGCNHCYSPTGCTLGVCQHALLLYCNSCSALLVTQRQPSVVFKLMFCRRQLCNADCPWRRCLGCCHKHGALRALYRRTGLAEHNQLTRQQYCLC